MMENRMTLDASELDDFDKVMQFSKKWLINVH